jgi:ribosomal protein S18 acetylase RimI-like enzyme
MGDMNTVIERNPLTAADRGRLELLCKTCTDFFELVEGQPGGMETAAEILGPLPAKVTSGEKSIFGLEREGELIGVVELLAGFPSPNEWYVGLLVLRPDARALGAGAVIWKDLRNDMKTRNATTVRLIVQKQNPGARRFWERQGFTVEKDMVTKVGKRESPAWLMHLSLEAAAQQAVAADGAAPRR